MKPRQTRFEPTLEELPDGRWCARHEKFGLEAEGSTPEEAREKLGKLVASDEGKAAVLRAIAEGAVSPPSDH